MNTQTTVLLSGTSNPVLSERIAKELGVKLGAVEITRFIDNECRVYIKEDVEGKEVFVIQSLSQIADQNLVELCLIGQALKALKATRVTAVIPWMGYSKQDKEFRKGEAVSAQLVAKFIEAAGFDHVLTVELHSENLIPYFKIPVTELSTEVLFGERLYKDAEEMVVVSPDKGGKSRSQKFAETVKLPIIYLDKTRDLASGEVVVSGASGSVLDKTVVIFDDIINTGATAIKTSEFLKQHGARKILFLATHPVLAGKAHEKLTQSGIDKVIVTDTILVPKKKIFEKLEMLTVASLLAAAIG